MFSHLMSVCTQFQQALAVVFLAVPYLTKEIVSKLVAPVAINIVVVVFAVLCFYITFF